jgi:hypothetical protein
VSADLGPYTGANRGQAAARSKHLVVVLAVIPIVCLEISGGGYCNATKLVVVDFRTSSFGCCNSGRGTEY